MIERPRLVATPFQQAVSDKKIDPRGPIRRRNETRAVAPRRKYGVAREVEQLWCRLIFFWMRRSGFNFLRIYVAAP
jgi:hypothetical protein